MKSYEEMAKDVFQRIDAYETDQRAKRAKVTKVAASVTPVCVAAAVGVGLWKGGVLSSHHDQLIRNSVESTSSDVILSANTNTSTGTSEENAISMFTTNRKAAAADATTPHTTENIGSANEVNSTDSISAKANTPAANNTTTPPADTRSSIINNGAQSMTHTPTVETTAHVQQSIPGADGNSTPAAPSSATEHHTTKAANSNQQTTTSVQHTMPAKTSDFSHQVIWATDDAAVDHFVEGLTEWHQFNSVGYRLYDALESGKDDDIFAILARPAVDYTFKYNGKTLAQYYSDMCNERNLPEILAQLQKEGDSLKYGDALYKTGTPTGEKWAQSWYEERIKYYGDAILGKYIVNGEFLSEKLEQDLAAAMNCNEATIAYKTAYGAYLSQVAASIHGELPAEVVTEENGIIMYLTREEFSVFSPDGISGWTFDLASKDNETTYQYGSDE
jgi:hypothetical protein